MSTHNLCFEHKYEKHQSFLSENFQFWEVKFSIYMNRRVFVMALIIIQSCRSYVRFVENIKKWHTLIDFPYCCNV